MIKIGAELPKLSQK